MQCEIYNTTREMSFPKGFNLSLDKPLRTKSWFIENIGGRETSQMTLWEHNQTNLECGHYKKKTILDFSKYICYDQIKVGKLI